MSASKYYNGVSVINSNCPINFSIGTRSAGKSYYFKRYCIKQYIEKGYQFIYLRRTIVDLEVTMPTWFDDIGNEFPKFAVTTDGHNIKIHEFNDDNEIIKTSICGYAFGLSEYSKLKSIPYENVMTIFFDEFIPDNLKYLKPSDPFYEPQALLSVYMTVARGFRKPIRPDVKIICVANAVTFFNPYFTYFGIDLTKRERGEFNGIYAERFVATEISKEIAATKFGQILSHTGYGQYALENKALVDVYSGIKQHKNGDTVFCMLYFKQWYTVYLSRGCPDAIIAKGFDKTFPTKYKLEDVEGYDKVPWFAGEIYRVFKKVHENGNLFYEDMGIKSIFAGLFAPRMLS